MRQWERDAPLPLVADRTSLRLTPDGHNRNAGIFRLEGTMQ
jgi:hypothetical protein